MQVWFPVQCGDGKALDTFIILRILQNQKEIFMKKKSRDLEKTYPTAEFVAKLRRLADALESGKRFAIMIAGERIFVPSSAVFNVEHEREGKNEEIEFQIKWINKK
jgi:amphi-Trp domain-containing protein